MSDMDINFYLLCFSIVLFVIVIILSCINWLLFKNNKSLYEELLSEYLMRGLPLDSITIFSSYMGDFNCYPKIWYFIYLYKNKKMMHKRGVPVCQDAYDFIQKLPPERIDWILKIHGIYRVIFFLSAIMMFLMWFATRNYKN